MKTKYLLLLTSLYFVLSASNCKKDDVPKDYIVREGNQAFGVYLNGQPWIPDYRDAGSGVTPVQVSMRYNSTFNFNYMWIRGLKNNEEVSLYIPPPLKTGRVSLNISTNPWPTVRPEGAYGMFEVYTPYKRFMTNSSINGFVDILSCDTLNSKIEGRFEFEAINTSTNEKIKITNGYFKLN